MFHINQKVKSNVSWLLEPIATTLSTAELCKKKQCTTIYCFLQHISVLETFYSVTLTLLEMIHPLQNTDSRCITNSSFSSLKLYVPFWFSCFINSSFMYMKGVGVVVPPIIIVLLSYLIINPLFSHSPVLE